MIHLESGVVFVVHVVGERVIMHVLTLPSHHSLGVQTLATMCMIQLSLVRSLQLAALEQMPSCRTVNIFALAAKWIFVTVVHSAALMCMIQLSLVRSPQVAALEQLPSSKTANFFALE
jgi:hypothetical protein